MQKYVQVLVDLLLRAVLAEEAAENTLAADPDDLGGEASLASTTALTVAGVATLALGLEALQIVEHRKSMARWMSANSTERLRKRVWRFN
jgi:hypothetical protein